LGKEVSKTGCHVALLSFLREYFGCLLVVPIRGELFSLKFIEGQITTNTVKMDIKVGIVITIVALSVYVTLVAANPVEVSVSVVFSLVLLVEYLHKVLVSVRCIVDYPLLALIIHKDKHLQITQHGKLDGFFQKTLLSFAVGHLSLASVFDEGDFVDFLFSHFK